MMSSPSSGLLEGLTGPGLVYPPGVWDRMVASWPAIHNVVVDANVGFDEPENAPDWFIGCVMVLWLKIESEAIPLVWETVRTWGAESIKIVDESGVFANLYLEWGGLPGLDLPLLR